MDDARSPVSASGCSTDLFLSLGARPITVPLPTGRIEISFGPVFGTTRAFLRFVGRATPPEAILRVPALGTPLDVPCQPYERWLISTRALTQLPAGTQLAFTDKTGQQRYTLWAAR